MLETEGSHLYYIPLQKAHIWKYMQQQNNKEETYLYGWKTDLWISWIKKE